MDDQAVDVDDVSSDSLYSESYSSSSSDEQSPSNNITFIEWLLLAPGSESLAIVPYEFLEDEFNLTDLPVPSSSTFPLDDCLDLLFEDSKPTEKMLKDQQSLIKNTFLVYNLVHQRYVMTKAGMSQIYSKWQEGLYGECPRTFCNKQSMLPIGLSSLPGNSDLAGYCPKCQDVYKLSNRFSRIDGCAFAPSFPHFLIKNMESEFKKYWNIWLKEEWIIYEPRIFGFKIHPTSPFAWAQSKKVRPCLK